MSNTEAARQIVSVSGEPPGTVILEAVHASSQAQNDNLILQPQPSSNPNDPLNWTKCRKYVNFFLVLFFCLMDFALLDIATVIYPEYNELLGISYPDLNNTYAANCVGLAFGCVFFIPLALKYGRRPIYLASTLALFLSAIWLALLSTYSQLLAVNILNGLAGATSETLIQMTIADMFYTHERATMISIYAFTVLTGASLGPVAAGYSADSQGFRWIWWWCAIFLGVNFAAFLVFYEETKYIPDATRDERPNGIAIAPTTDETTVIAKDTENSDPKELITSLSKTEETSTGLIRKKDAWIDGSIPVKPYSQRMAWFTTSPGNYSLMLRHLYQPFQALTFPAVTFAGIQYAFVLAWVAITATLVSELMAAPPFNYSSQMIGLMSLPGYTGALIGTLYSGPFCDWFIVWRAKRNNGIFDPEMRLTLCFLPIFVGPAGIWIFGYYLANGDSWVNPAIGLGLNGFSGQAMTTLSLTYLADCYNEILGDSLVGVAFIRNAIATAVVFAISPWQAGMGTWHMFLLAGFLALIVNLLALPMWWYGKRSRSKCAEAYLRLAKRQFDPRGHAA